jgi:hypothetical protein
MNNRLKSEALFPSRYTRITSKRNYIKTDFILAKNKSKNNRIWEYPEEKDIIPLSPSLWEMNEGESQEQTNIDIDIDGQIEQSDLLTHKSKATDLSKKESEKSNRRIDKEKGAIRIAENPLKGYDRTSSEQEISKIAQSNLKK